MLAEFQAERWAGAFQSSKQARKKKKNTIIVVSCQGGLGGWCV